jgi:hypothetical protein
MGPDVQDSADADEEVYFRPESSMSDSHGSNLPGQANDFSGRDNATSSGADASSQNFHLQSPGRQSDQPQQPQQFSSHRAQSPFPLNPTGPPSTESSNLFKALALLPNTAALCESDQEAEDVFAALSTHMMSVQSLLNKHRDRAKMTAALHQNQMLELDLENRQLRARLEHVISAFTLPAQDLLGIHVPSVHGLQLQGETGGSVSNSNLEGHKSIPTPPTREYDVAKPDSNPPSLGYLPGCLDHTMDPPGVLPPAEDSWAEDDNDGTEDDRPVSSDLPPSVVSERSETVKCATNNSEPESLNSKDGSPKSGGSKKKVQPLSESPRTSGIGVLSLACSGAPPDESTHPAKKGKERRRHTLFTTSADELACPQQQKSVFADAAAMKEKVRAAIGKPEYNVADCYHESGWAQWLATNLIFEQITLSVIFFNAIWIAVDADLNKEAVLSHAKPEFQIAENSFCTFFLFELGTRFTAFKYKRNCLRDRWFVFDAFLVILMVVETWILVVIFVYLDSLGSGNGTNLGDASSLRLLRLLRLTRMARLARLLRAMPELMILIKGMVVAMRSVFFTLCLLGIIVYLFAIAFSQLTAGTEIGSLYFATVPDSMTSLLLRAALPDVADMVYEVSNESVIYGVVLLFFILFASLTVMNMLVGVLCEVVSVVSAVEKETLVVNFVQGQLRAILEHFCEDAEDSLMTKIEFTKLLGNPTAARALNEVGVDVLGLLEITDFLFKDAKKISFPDFMEMVLELRGSNTATVKHIVDLQRFVHLELQRNMMEMGKHCEDMSETIKKSIDQDKDEVVVQSPEEEEHVSALAIRGSRAGKRTASPGRTRPMKR